MAIFRKVGNGLIILGTVMFLIGVSFFTYQGSKLPAIIFDIGQFSFLLWLPTLIIGVILVSVTRAKSLRK